MNWILLTAATLTIVPLAVVAGEIVLALLPRRRRTDDVRLRPTVDVLIPAHNEELGLAATLESIAAQRRPGDRVFVVADNCTDATAEVARRGGAAVCERFDDARRGKGFALEYGRTMLEPNHGEIVVIVDADCRLEPGTLDALAATAAESGRPVQADYLMTSPPQPTPRDVVSQFAVTVKNRVRQRGVARLGGAAVLTGSGMAFPWDVFRTARLDGGNIVEDMQLSFDLLLAGHAPLYCGDACVTAPLPQRQNASRAQRTRWEHGHLQTLVRRVPKLVVEAVRQRRWILLGSAVDLSVPPLALSALVWFAMLLVCGAAALRGYSAAPVVVLGIAGLVAAGAMAAALARFGNGISAFTVLAAVPRYVVGKVPIYTSFLFRRQKTWVRTDRDQMPTPPHIGSPTPGRTAVSHHVHLSA